MLTSSQISVPKIFDTQRHDALTSDHVSIVKDLCSLLLCMLILFGASWSYADPVQSVVLNQELLQQFKRVQVRVPVDPFYRGGELIAEGVKFDDVLKSHLRDEIKSHPDRYLIRFVCSDGYMTTYPFSSTIGGVGVIADRLISLAPQETSPARAHPPQEHRPWPIRKRGKIEDHPGPYYLLWRDERYSKHRPWPYQLTSIDILPANHLAALEPDPKDGVDAGYQLFAVHCKACHAMNLVGGTMGPELNVPQNILSYRDREQLLEFIKNPKIFRFSSLMPPSVLSRQDIGLILDYLKAMSNRRVCQTLEECQRIAPH